MSLSSQHCWGEEEEDDLTNERYYYVLWDIPPYDGHGAGGFYRQTSAATRVGHILDHLVGIFCFKYELTGLKVDMSVSCGFRLSQR